MKIKMIALMFLFISSPAFAGLADIFETKKARNGTFLGLSFGISKADVSQNNIHGNLVYSEEWLRC